MNRCILMIGLLLLVSVAAYAVPETDTTTQTFSVGVAEIAAIGTTGTPGALLIDNPSDNLAGGAVPAPSTSSTTKVQYTSIVNDQSKHRTISAALTTGVVPGGCDLSVAGGAIVAGSGTVGAGASGGVLDSGAAVSVVSGIGSCWTGTGTSDGNVLTYSLAVEVGQIGALKVAAPSDVTVTLTLLGEG